MDSDGEDDPKKIKEIIKLIDKKKYRNNYDESHDKKRVLFF